MIRLSRLFFKPIGYYKKLSIEKRSVVWYTACNILQKGISVLTIPIITRLLTTEEYGSYSVFLSWRDILMILATLNLYTGVFTKILVDNKDKSDEYTSVIQWLGGIIASVLFFIFILFRNSVAHILGYNTFTLMMLFAYYVFYPAFLLWCAKQRVNNHYVSMVIVTVMVSLAIPLLTILLIVKTSLRSYGPIWGMLLIDILTGMVFFVVNTVKGKRIYEKTVWKGAIEYSIPLIPHYLSMFALAQSDRLMIKYIESNAKAGIYSLAYQISSMMNIVFNAVNNAFVPRAYRLMRDKNNTLLIKESMKLIFGALLLTVIGIVIAPEFVWLMGGEQYAEAIFVVPAVCLAVFVRFGYSFFCNYQFYYSKTKNIMLASVIAAVTNVILNWIFIPVFGYYAAGYTTLVSYILLFVFHFCFAKRIIHEQFHEQGFQQKTIITLLLVTVVLSAGLPILYDYAVVRYVIFAVIVAYGIINRKKVKALIH